ncbi:C4-type zinc ribbon domain-containing protein [Actinotalea sp. M2MS4P-6]|uniref:zinc ribbon domain-containing protein n=1 Tax=Actinotalea sp. M2MS4P-6 TaxID=2983762 RepID=UPI0021E50120|nr:C4-type zinc ribbon domain-containing protein [Actinotalea sp. M2MS4P-6]MCV2393811.1 C4-type zinc ribbon domain-containing protein [Actinotalea sp. M2MS4P-6]
MTTAPVADQHRLLEVQALDTRLQQLDHARRTHPTRARIAELEQQVGEAAEALAAGRTTVGDVRRELAKAEADVEQVRTRAERDQARMQAGGSMKDVQALSAELDALAKRTEALEEIELEVMERLEAEEATLAERGATHERLAAELASAQRELDAAIAVLDDEAQQVTAQRAQKADGLDSGLVALYDRLRGQLGGLGVAALRGRTCEGCRLELNPSDVARITAAPDDQVLRCEECGRILVRGAAR